MKGSKLKDKNLIDRHDGAELSVVSEQDSNENESDSSFGSWHSSFSNELSGPSRSQIRQFTEFDFYFEA